MSRCPHCDEEITLYAQLLAERDAAREERDEAECRPLTEELELTMRERDEAIQGCERVEREREDARQLDQEAMDELRALRAAVEAERERLKVRLTDEPGLHCVVREEVRARLSSILEDPNRKDDDDQIR